MKTTYFVDGPGGVKWSIWDYGDEMTVNSGPTILSDVVARIRPEIVRKMDAGHKWQHVVSAASSIRVADMLGSDMPNFKMLWR